MLTKNFLLAEEILTIVLKFKKLSTNKIAKDLDLSSSTVSQWKNYANGKFKKVHQIALETLYQIPSDIYEKSFNSEYEVIEYLRNNLSFNNQKKFDDSTILSQLVGRWYCYNYTSSKDLGKDYWEDILDIREDRSIININNDGDVYSVGKIKINQAQTTITLFRKGVPINILFDNRTIAANAFFAFLIAKSKNVFNDIAEFVIICKDRLSKEQVLYALGDRSKNQVIIDQNAKERLSKAINSSKIDSVDRYNPYYILKNHIGKWHLYNYSNKKEHQIVIDFDKSVEWIVDGVVDSKGKIYIHEHDIIIILEDKRGFRSYLFLGINEQKTKLCCMKSRAGLNHTNFFAIGVISRDKLSSEFVKNILKSNDKSYLNISNIRDNLWKKVI